jgi:hypothetical protein
MPEGDPPLLEIGTITPMGEGLFLLEGKTQPGVYVAIDDGYRIHAARVEPDGSFKKNLQIFKQGEAPIKVTARASNGLETTRAITTNVRFN